MGGYPGRLDLPGLRRAQGRLRNDRNRRRLTAAVGGAGSGRYCMHPIVIVGTGLAGYATAHDLRKRDTATPLVMLGRDDAGYYYKPDISEALGKAKTPAQLVQKPAAAMASELDADIRARATVSAIDAKARTLTVD